MLDKAREWRDRMKVLSTETSDKEYVQKHIDIIEYLIEQAEKAQKYDSALISLESNKQYVSELLEQNKHYREAIEIAMRNIKGINNLGVNFALGVLEETLRMKQMSELYCHSTSDERADKNE